ncbi:MAG: DNA repair protein RecN, partial [Clostridia bacterium]|nr:DNA repair protein RecN [Clostridia bacterium]
DPTAEIDRLEGRLDVITRLSRKYGEGIPAILAFREKAAARLDELDTADDRLADLEAELVPLEKELRSLAARLTARRQASAASLAKAVMESLAFLDMPRVRFEVTVRPRKDFGPDGVDEVEFLIATNPGEAMGPLARIASGGELSRIMLAIRSVLNERDGVGTAIYDEVDAGISGRTARKVGIKLADIAERGAQVICVTHSAQIASLAGAHYVIEKQESAEEGGTRVETFVHRVSEEDRVEEIARILGGLSVTDTQREAARSLIRERTV